VTRAPFALDVGYRTAPSCRGRLKAAQAALVARAARLWGCAGAPHGRLSRPLDPAHGLLLGPRCATNGHTHRSNPLPP